jgi:hypothetical protein
MREAFRERRRVETELRHSPGLLRLDQDIGTGEQIDECPTIVFAVEVERQSEFVRIAKGEIEASTVRIEGGKTPRASAATRFDTDDFGTKVAQDATGELALLIGEVDYAESSQGSFIRHALFNFPSR